MFNSIGECMSKVKMLTEVVSEVKKEAPQEKLKVSYRSTKGEGIGKGDTRITKKLKKAGFTETRLAKLRKKHAEFKAKRKKKKK